jgi:predicted ribosomally synthesized peptide with SipW-like signal peptide
MGGGYMTNDRIELTRRKILAATGAVGVAGAGAGLGSSAFFSDQETFVNNRLVAGELDLKVAWQEHYSNWMDDDYGDDPPLGAETEFARMPGSDEDPSFRLPPGSGQLAGKPIELVFEDDPGADEGFDSRPDQEDGGRQFLRNTAVETANGGVFANNDLCGTDADVPDRPLIDLADVKPGDFGFGLFRFQLCTNPGYVWLTGGLESAMENGLSEPEAEDPDEDGDADSTDPADVELLDAIQVAYGVGTTNNLAPGVSPEDSLLPEGEQVDGAPQPAEQLSLREFLYLVEAGDGLPLDGTIDAEDGGGSGRDCFAGETEHFVSVVWWLPIDHGNEVQTDSVTFDLGFYTEQCRHNEGISLSSGLVGYWPLDGVDDGIVVDYSSHGNDGTVVGDVSSVTGQVAKAGSFDGDADYVEIPANSSLGVKNVTVSAWVYRDGSKNREYVFDGRNHNYGIKLADGTNKPLFFVSAPNSDSLTASAPIPDQTWTHVAGTYDGSEVKLYVDGAVDQTGTGAGDINTSSGPARIGDYIGDGYSFRGWIDDVRIYDRALSDQEVQDLATL